MHIINASLKHALDRYRVDAGSVAEASRKLGLSRTLIARILNGNAAYISDTTWARISPALMPYFRSVHCEQGYQSCPLVDRKLERLMRLILSVGDPQWYERLIEVVTAEKRALKSAQKTSAQIRAKNNMAGKYENSVQVW